MPFKSGLKYTKLNNKILLNTTKFSALRQSLLDKFFDENTYVEFQENGTTIITIEKLKLDTKYDNLDKSKDIRIDKIVFLNDIRSSLPEILSSPGGRRAKFSYFTNDMIENFFESFKENKDFKLSTMDINLISKRRVGYEQFYIVNKGKEIEFESSSSGEKNSAILELICTYYANQYDFKKSFQKNILELVINKMNISNLQTLQSYLDGKNLKKFLNIIIEEPETNLFPTNQKDIVYFLSSLRKAENKPNILFSTHSPYILTALNKLLCAGILEKRYKIKPSCMKLSIKNILLKVMKFLLIW